MIDQVKVVRVEHQIRLIHLILNQLDSGIEVVVRYQVLVHEVCDCVIRAVIHHDVRDKALVGQDRHMRPVREDVHACKQAGIVLDAEQVQNRRQDVDIAAIGIAGNRGLIGHKARPTNKGVFLAVKGLCQLPPGQLIVLVVHQAIGVVVAGQDNDGFIQNALFFQLLHQVFQGVFQLQIAGDIGLDNVAVLDALFSQIGLHGLPVLFCHRIHREIIGIVAGIGHIVCDEGLALFQNNGQRLLDHLQIGGRVAFGGVGHPVDVGILGFLLNGLRLLGSEPALKAHVRMGIVALVEGADVVVEEVGTIAQTAEGIADAVGEVVFRGLDEAAVPLVPRQIREHAHTEGIFAVRGRVGKGRVVIVEQEALVRQLVEGRRQILCNENRGIGLTAELNQIAPLEIARVAVLRGSLRIAEILVQGLDALVIGIGVQIFKVDGKDVFCIGRCYGAAFHVLHLRQTGNDELIVLVVVLRREEELTGLQPHRSHHTKAVDAFVRDDGAAVIGAEGSVPLRAAQTQGENAARPKQYDQPNKNQVKVADAFAEGLRHVLGAQNVEHNGDRED